jgi:hypothetical protein
LLVDFTLIPFFKNGNPKKQIFLQKKHKILIINEINLIPGRVTGFIPAILNDFNLGKGYLYPKQVLTLTRRLCLKPKCSLPMRSSWMVCEQAATRY